MDDELPRLGFQEQRNTLEQTETNSFMQLYNEGQKLNRQRFKGR